MTRRAASALLLVAAACAACDLPRHDDAVGGPRVLGSDPAPSDTGVDRATAPRVWLDRPVLPGLVHRGTVTLGSGTRSVLASPWFDPAERVLRVELPTALDPEVVYRLRIDGLRDLDRQLMSEPFELAFSTGLASVGAPDEQVGYAQVEPILASCAVSGCHAPPSPPLGLDLSSPEAVRATAIGVPAEQSRVGVEGTEAWRLSSVLAGLPRIDVVGGVGQPARSYLLYKVLGDPHVWGDRMPPEPSRPLSREEEARLSQWIRSGAPTR